MAYVPPNGDAVPLRFGGGGTYTPPHGDAVPIRFGPVAGTGGTAQVQSVSGSITFLIAITGSTGQAQSIAGGVFPLVPQRIPLVAGFEMAWERGSSRDDAAGIPFRSASTVDAGVDASWGRGDARDRAVDASWRSLNARDASTAPAWASKPPKDVATISPWRGDLPPADRFSDQRWDAGSARDASIELPWGEASTADLEVAPCWDAGDPADRRIEITWNGARRADGAVRIPWQRVDGIRDEYLLVPEPLPPVPPRRVCYVPPPGDAVPIRFRGGGAYPPPHGDAVPIRFACDIRYLYARRSVVMSHTVSVVRLPERTPLRVAADITVGTSVDAWCWSCSARLLDRASYNLVMPDAAGPKSIEVSIDGHVWTFVVEDVSEDRRFGKTTFQIRGRSRTALLADPYVAKRGYTNSSDISSGALAERELEFTDFALDWQGPLWTVPPGAWSYAAETPISALLQLARACGCVVQSHPNEDALIVSPRYPAAPWNWDATTPDVSLQGAALTQLGAAWKPGARYLGVYVSGRDQGVLVSVSRAGTTGSPTAEMIVDPLITDVLPAEGRGLGVIAESENQTELPVTMPFGPDGPGPLLPTELVELIDPIYGTYRAEALSSEIRVGRSNGAVTVRQSVRLARHHSEEV